MAKKIDYFVKFFDKNHLYEEILLVQKTLINNLKRCELFKQLRKNKLEEIDKLREVVKEIIELNNVLRQQMPKLDRKVEKEIMRAEKPETTYDYGKELERLEKSVAEIEKKLKELDNV